MLKAPRKKKKSENAFEKLNSNVSVQKSWSDLTLHNPQSLLIAAGTIFFPLQGALLMNEKLARVKAQLRRTPLKKCRNVENGILCDLVHHDSATPVS